jgi:hypothetical protein
MPSNVNKYARLFAVSLTLFLLYAASANNMKPTTVEAAPTLSISFYKDNGYGLGNDMAGLWTVNAQVSSDVVTVEFYLDDQLQLNDTSAPFSWQFDTGNYALGNHTIKAVAYNSSGEQAIAEQQRNFVEFPTTFVFGITIAAVVVAVVIAVIAAIYKIRRSKPSRPNRL